MRRAIGAIPVLAASVGVCVVSALVGAPPVNAYPGGVTGKTNKSGGTGCVPCHNGSNGGADPGMTAAISGPASLAPGQLGTYLITISKASVPNGSLTGIDVAASDATLSVVSGQPTSLRSDEIVHDIGVGPLKTTSSASASYQFNYTMPLSAAVGSTHTLYGTAALTVGSPFSLSWNHAANYVVSASAPPAPTSLTATTLSSNSVSLTWAGTTAEFRVIYKAGSTPSSPTDGTLVHEGSNTAATVSSLSASTSYTFAAYGKVSGFSTYSTTAQTANATTNASTSVTRYVSVVSGNDNGGANDCLTAASPCKTIKQAMSMASTGAPGDTISVGSGVYNTASGETFPITMKSGVKLIGSGGAFSNKIDAAGANTRVFLCSGNNANTLIEGFTIAGGFVQPNVLVDGPVNSSGGAMSMTNNDQTTISRNVFTVNEARGYSGTGVSFVSGGQAYGGALYVAGASPTIVNNVFSGNTVRGGRGVDNFGTSTPGGGGGNGDGGAIYWASGAGVIINNTFYANQARGGDGGGSTSGPGGNGGNGIAGAVDSTGASVVNNIFMINSAGGGAGGGGAPLGSGGSATYGALFYSSAPSSTNNLLFGNAAGGDTIGSNAVLQDGLLHSNGNWHLRYMSPAIGAGTATGAPTIDIDGTTRANPPSIGAYEAAALAPATTGSTSNPTLGSDVALGTTGVTINFSAFTSTFASPQIIADYYSSGRTGAVPTANASAYFWTVAAFASSLSGTVTFDFTGKGVGNPSTVKLLRRQGSGTPWTEVTGVTRSGNTISTGVTGFSDFALGDVQAGTTTTVGASPSPADAGHPITFTATVTGTGGPPTGTVTFSEGGPTLGIANLVSGMASVATSGCSENAVTCLHVGSHTITATYGGNVNFGGSSGTVALTVNKDSTTTTLASSSSTVTVGSPITLTATVFCHSGSPYGTVVFKDGTTALGTANVTNTLASLATSSLGVGTHSLTAEYAGSLDFLASSSSALSVIVNAGTGATTLSIADATVPEGNSGTSTASFTVTLANPGSQTVTVNFATADGTATAGSDYVAASGTLNFPSGTTSQTISLTVNGDATAESNETFTVTLSNPTNATLARAAATGTISNDDSATPTAALSIGDVTVAEGNSGTTTASFAVTLANGGSQTVTVNYATADGTATAGSDYVAASGTLTFASGTTSQTISVTVNGDTTVEPNETFSVTLSSPTNASLGRAAATATISNDDSATPTPTLSIDDASVSEGNSGTTTASFKVTLASGGSQTVTVSYATADGTATAGSDYVAASGTLTFPSGTTSQTISVTVNGDTAVEPNETFAVNLSSPTNATLARAAATGTINNDDSTTSTTTISIDDRSVTEGSATAAAFRVFLSAASTQNVTVDYATADGAAKAGSDYTATSGTLTFTPGRTQHTIVVPILSDSAIEGIEMFFVNLSNPTGATIADGQAMGTISDPPSTQHVPMYRAYNKNTDYHFFTTDKSSRDFAVNVLGFQDESTPAPFYVSNVQLTNMIPLFRMYNPNLGRHYYTGGTSNRDFLMSIGMVYEKDEGFIYPIEAGAQIAGTTELFRLYNNNSGTHLFTASAAQKDGIINLFPGVWVLHSSVGIVFTSP